MLEKQLDGTADGVFVTLFNVGFALHFQQHVSYHRGEVYSPVAHQECFYAMSVALLIEFKCESRPSQYLPIATQGAFVEVWKPLFVALKARGSDDVVPAIDLLLNAETGGPVPLTQASALIKALGQLEAMLETRDYDSKVRDGVLSRVSHVSKVLRELSMDQVSSIWLG